ncbi:hypothetical protein NE619_03420 [Anaerovorax odorimutans]|uniref:Uncharacterized protein n=1 Tax=Anaerovorax odorimutans TaxID=109327 RepID=A0ABT1RKR0_9FIRM|nr:hypothetical protein [Anaerovorax odorimutans]MCQ4635765.1 hypothetical protein [Anaerovorax odorimutans]
MYMQIGADIKAKIMRDVEEAVKEFQARPDIKTRFGEPIVGYADSRNPIFDMYFSRTICDHPKRIYRPGNTVVVHFVPFAPEITESNRGGDQPSEEWLTAFNESMWLSMRLNGVIREALDTVGRLSSCTNTPTDWDEERCREEWSHKLVAYAAGMGEFGPAGSFKTKNGFAGRFGSIITDGQYAEAFEVLNAEQLEAMYQEIQRQYCYKEAKGVSCSQEMIKACPAGAISETGIDRKICQAHCKKINELIPSPEVCGKCFFY